MFAVAFVLFLLGNGCVRDARGQNGVARSLGTNGYYYACGGQNRDGMATPLGKCNATKNSGNKHNINCPGDEQKRGSANLTECAPTKDLTVLYTDCNGTVEESPNHTITGPFTVFITKCFGNRYADDQNGCASVHDHHSAFNCTKVLSDYQTRNPTPTNNGSVVTRGDKKESPKQKQNDGPANMPQRSEVNVTEQNRPTSVERNESREVTTPHTSTSSGTVLLMGLHARVFCVLQLLRLLK
ncbi:hypothetical protein ERJ75_001209700 [Trypanosoma vivax]|nr:hypothetical protein ERJ75_001209700 [Trypanosoma vivax]